MPDPAPSPGLAPAHPCSEPGVEFSSRRSGAGSGQAPDVPLGLRVRTCLVHVLALFRPFLSGALHADSKLFLETAVYSDGMVTDNC